MSEIKLLPCPFCGGEAEIECEGYFYKWFVRCKKCFCKTPTHTMEHFAKVCWNTRKPMQEIVERLEESYQFYEVQKKEAYEDDDWEDFDRNMNINRGIYQALAIVKEVGGMND